MRKDPLSLCTACLLLIPALLLGGAPAVFAGGTWADATRQFRLPVTAGGGGFDRSEKPAELPVNFTTALSSIGRSGSLDENSLRVVEVDAGGNVLDLDVPWQFDKDADFNAASKASGTIILILKGTTASSQDRYYDVYFALSGGSYVPATVTPQVTFTDNVQDAGQASYKLETAGGTYYYHKQGAGFSSWLDADGNDWLSFDPTPGSGGAGEFRGIPNSCYPEGYFHPGKTSSTSSVVSQGPLKVTYRSTTNDNLWECVWEVFPRYARMTMVKADHPFWLLYEGTPGGSIESSTDFMTFSDGTVKALSETWTGELSGDEWVYFSDPNTAGSGRSLYLALHENDSFTDSYFTLSEAMTVWGFGRDNVTPYLTPVPKHMTIGLTDGTGYSASAKTIRGAYKPLTPVAGTLEERSAASPVLVSPANGATGIPTTALFVWRSVGGATAYGLQVASDSLFGSGFAFNDSTLADTSRSVSGFSPASTYFWRVRAKSSGVFGSYSEVRRFSTVVGTPVLRAPSNGALGQPSSVTLRWSPIAGATAYHVQASTDPSYSTGLLLDNSAVADTTVSANSLPVGTIVYWHVRAQSAVGPGAFTSSWVFTTIPGAPELVSPADGTTGVSYNVTLHWKKLSGATAYRLRVSTNPTFASGIVFDDSTLVDTLRTVSGLLDGSTYYWRVAGRQGGGEGPASSTRSFSTVTGSPAPVSPANGVSGLVSPVTFVWQKVAGALTYHFQLASDSTFQSGFVKNDSTLTDTSRIVVGMATGQRYYWRMSAKTGAGPTSFSPAWALRMQGTFPSKVVLLTPADYATTIRDSVVFRWQKSTPAVTEYWFDLGLDSMFVLALTDSAVKDTQKIVGSLAGGWKFWRVRGANAEGWGPYSDNRRIFVTTTVVEPGKALPQSVALMQNFPNPFNPATVIQYALPEQMDVRLDIFTILGERIVTLVDGRKPAGIHSVQFEAMAQGSGVYLYRLTAGATVLVRTMVVLK
jgi:hypothetical protein